MAQMNPQQLGEHLKKKVSPLYLVYGDEPLQRQEVLDTIRQSARTKGYTERHSFTIQGKQFDFSALLSSLSAQSLFSDLQMLEIHVPTSKPGREGAQILQQIAQDTLNLPANDLPAMVVVVVLSEVDFATQKTGWFSALLQAAISVKIAPIDRTQLPQWLKNRITRRNLTLPNGDEGSQILDFLATKVEGNLLAAHQEIEKLALLYPNQTLTLDAVQQCVMNVARYSVFQLREALLGGQLLRTKLLLQGLQNEGEPVVSVHWALSEEIRTLYSVKEQIISGVPLVSVLKSQRIWNNREALYKQLFSQNGHEIRLGVLRRLLYNAYIVDGITKGIVHSDFPSDPWQAVLQLCVQCVQSLRRTPV